MAGADLIVTNFNRNFTGVSATAAGVVRRQADRFDMKLAGHALPGCPSPISKSDAIELARQGPVSRPFQIWHVRRNPEMQTALWVRDVLRLPIRIVFTSAAQRRHSAWPRFLISRMDAIIATTKEAANHVGNVWSVVPHGVDTTAFRPSEDRPQDWHGLGYGGTRAIACIGRVRPEKGTDRFVDMAIRLLPRIPGLTALVVGRAKREHQRFQDELMARISRAGLGERIVFTGEISPDNLPRLVRALDLLVALPRYEGYGMTPLEAMASGVPVVASDTGHFREFTGDGEAGLVLGDTNPDHVAVRVEKLLADKQLLADMANGAVNRANTLFSVEQEVAGINDVYQRIWNPNTA